MDSNPKKIYRYSDNITWSLPLFFQYEPIWAAIYDGCKYYGIKPPKANIYGSPANAWTAGRVPIIFNKIEKDFLINIINYLLDFEVTPTFVFSYSGIEKEDLADKYANYLLDMGLEVGAHFIVNSDMLKNYIKEKDSKAYVVASVTKPAMRFQGPTKIEEPTTENETNYYNKLLKEYDLVVVRPEYSLNVMQENPHLLDDISRIEVLINQSCIQDCPLMPAHYKLFENERMLPGVNSNTDFKCYKLAFSGSQLVKYNSIHDCNEVQKLVDIGVRHLKLQGRSMTYSMQAFTLYIFNQIFNTLGAMDMMAMDIMANALETKISDFKQNVLKNKIFC